MAPCLTEDHVLELLSGRVSSERRAEIDAHLDECPACFAVVARTASRVALPDAASAPTVAGTGQAPPQTRFLVGRRFGNFLLEKVLGAGGMGVVYAGIHPGIGKRVAIKFLAQ